MYLIPRYSIYSQWHLTVAVGEAALCWVVILGPCMNLVIAVSIVVTSTESCPLSVLHVLPFQMSSERVYSDLILKESYCKHRKPWIRQGCRFDVNEINIQHWRNCLFYYKATTRCFTEPFFFFKKNIHRVMELYCFLLLRYNQNNFFFH